MWHWGSGGAVGAVGQAIGQSSRPAGQPSANDRRVYPKIGVREFQKHGSSLLRAAGRCYERRTPALGP
jgi:hypothetical protein